MLRLKGMRLRVLSRVSKANRKFTAFTLVREIRDIIITMGLWVRAVVITGEAKLLMKTITENYNLV